MGVSVKEQLLVFLFCIPVGMGVGFLFDWFRVIKKELRTNKTAWGDAAFFTIAAFFLFGAIFRINDGDFRAYEWVSVGIGILLYRTFFSRIVMKLSETILKISGKIIRLFLRVLLLPMVFTARLFKKPIITVIYPARIFGKHILSTLKGYRRVREKKRWIAKKMWKKI